MGKRKIGRPRKGDAKMEHRTICLPPEMWEKIKQAGEGEYSRGLRKMLEGKE